MDNQETLAILGTQDTERRQATHESKHNTAQLTKIMSNTDPAKKPWVNPCTREG